MASPEPVTLRPAPLLDPTAASSALVGATCLAALLDAWYRHGVWVADLTSADATNRTVGVLYLITTIAAGVALLVWLSRVRANARLFGAAHPPRRWLAIGGWFAVSLFAVTVTFGLRVDAPVADLKVLATIESAAAVAQCVAGALVIVVVRQVTGRPPPVISPA